MIPIVYPFFCVFSVTAELKGAGEEGGRVALDLAFEAVEKELSLVCCQGWKAPIVLNPRVSTKAPSHRVGRAEMRAWTQNLFEVKLTIVGQLQLPFHEAISKLRRRNDF